MCLQSRDTRPSIESSELLLFWGFFFSILLEDIFGWFCFCFQGDNIINYI